MASLSDLIPRDFLGASPAPRPSREGEADPGLRFVPVDQVRPNPSQPRTDFDLEAIEGLAESIRLYGVLTPLLVRRADAGEGGYVLIAGERRLRASALAGLDTVPVCVREDVGSREQLELALVENLQREDLDAVETAQGYARLAREFKMTQEEVARRVGKDRATIANAIRLLSLPGFALAELRAGRLSAGHARALLGAPDDAALKTAMLRVLQDDLSVRATERLVRALARPPPTRAASPAGFRAAEERLERAFGTRARIRGKRGRGRIVIEYFSADELDALIDRFGANPSSTADR